MLPLVPKTYWLDVDELWQAATMRSEWYWQWLQVLYYVRSWLHIEALWFANVANQLMWCAANPHTD